MKKTLKMSMLAKLYLFSLIISIGLYQYLKSPEPAGALSGNSFAQCRSIYDTYRTALDHENEDFKSIEQALLIFKGLRDAYYCDPRFTIPSILNVNPVSIAKMQEQADLFGGCAEPVSCNFDPGQVCDPCDGDKAEHSCNQLAKTLVDNLSTDYQSMINEALRAERLMENFRSCIRYCTRCISQMPDPSLFTTYNGPQDWIASNCTGCQNAGPDPYPDLTFGDWP